MFITPDPEIIGIHTMRPTDRALALQHFERWNRTKDAVKTLNEMHHIDEATGPEDYEKAGRDLDAAMVTLIDPDAREILSDLAEETGVSPVLFVSASIRAYAGIGSGRI